MLKDLFSHARTVYSKLKPSDNSVNPMLSGSSKVSGYLPPAVYDIPPAVYDQLMAFKTKRGLPSAEMAVTVILSEYFGLLQPPIITATDTTSRLETLETNCTSLSETVAELRAAIATLQASSSPPLEESELPSPTPLSASHHEAANEPSETDSLLDNPEEQGEELVESESLNQPFSSSMTQAALAKRLSVGTSTISRMQSKPNFPEWSQQKDPKGIAWVKSPDTKLFYPQTHE